ncbi:MAG TPA: radical SAM protein [Anaerolineaceae bacterium]|mgnify:CR=1 FL=1|nr:radical SAM protein [Anaerolineaceae bacterium]HPN52529.1 radical SAM protein [Anaerolineaceae bacterium]
MILSAPPFLLNLKSACLTISQELPQETRVASFDLAGRLWTAMSGGAAFRRGLDGKIIAKWGAAEIRQRRSLPPDDTQQLLLETSQMAASALAALPPSSDSLLRQVLEAAAAFTPERAAADAGQFRQVYSPIGILPPDHYTALVLQAASGCPFNTCTFCSFYKSRPFHVKTPPELADHIRAVKSYLGRGLSLRRTLFLGDANALSIPMPQLMAQLEVIHRHLDVPALGGLYAFCDGFSGEQKSYQDYAALVQAGFQRTYIGLESGSPDLINLLQKPGTPQEAIRAVRRMKEGGLAVGVIILLGAGGQAYSRRHVAESIAALNAMPLDQDDIVYFSELVETEEGPPTARNAFKSSLRPLSPDACQEQAHQIEEGLVFTGGSTPHISRYDIRDFIY